MPLVICICVSRYLLPFRWAVSSRGWQVLLASMVFRWIFTLQCLWCFPVCRRYSFPKLPGRFAVAICMIGRTTHTPLPGPHFNVGSWIIRIGNGNPFPEYRLNPSHHNKTLHLPNQKLHILCSGSSLHEYVLFLRPGAGSSQSWPLQSPILSQFACSFPYLPYQ